ncbi:MAG: hypothetical protein IJM80_04220 [Firmicutes bacterium]|nr:hypothetical protein [Bacillota bacterium]
MKLKEYADLVRNRNTPAVLLRQEEAFCVRRSMQSGAQLQLFFRWDRKTGQMIIFGKAFTELSHAGNIMIISYIVGRIGCRNYSSAFANQPQ